MDDEDRKRIAALEKLHGVPRAEEWVTEHPPAVEAPPDAFAAAPEAEQPAAEGSPTAHKVNGNAAGSERKRGSGRQRGKR